MDHARKIAAWRRASKRGPYPFELPESELLEAMKAMDKVHQNNEAWDSEDES